MSSVEQRTERKYEPSGDLIAALRQTPYLVAGTDGPLVRLDAVYYDTEDLRLLKAGLTLRHRTGGSDPGWHLKLPVRAGVRDELRYDGGDGTVPAALAAYAGAHARGRPMVPVAKVSTERLAGRLCERTGRPLAGVVIDTVVARTLIGTPRTSAWTEFEVEPLAGDQTVLAAVDKAMVASGARAAATPHKLAKLFGYRPPPHPASSSEAGGIVAAFIRTQAETLLTCDSLVRLDRPDAVHQMRVACRRIRSALLEYGPLFDQKPARRLADDLKWLGGVLSPARDREVLLTRLTARLDEVPAELRHGPVGDRVQTYLRTGLEQALRSALGSMGDPRYWGLLDRLDAFLADPPITRLGRRPAAKVLPLLLHRSRRRLARALAHIPSAPNRDVAVHEARKAAKRARYAAEVIGRNGRRAELLQEALGQHQDSVTARRILLDLADQAHRSGEDTFTYGLLYGREAERAKIIEARLTR